ncbi:MAG TPA: hypothetical protein VHJ56_08070 [Candidatus Binatia bacterium]|jgi:hypothetical protein|nr:hypothetical protein [Candidatus Binatia bacterium]
MMRDEHPRSEDLENYAGGEIQARHGIINRWLLGLYAVLFVWSIYYLVGPFDGWRPTFLFWGWGGLGPGLSSKGAEQGVEGLGVIGIIGLSIALVSILGFFAWIVILARRR